MTYSPSFLAFTQERPRLQVTVEGENLSQFTMSHVQVVAITKVGERLDSVVCNTLNMNSFMALSVTNNKVLLDISITENISGKLKGCLTSKNQYLALQLNIPTSQTKGKVSTQQTALLPLFDQTQGNLLTATRNASVLGELTSHLKINQLSCDRVVIFSRTEFTCTTAVTNTTDSAVITNIVSTVREGISPGLTLYEKLERTNILILPGESYNITFAIPKDSYKSLNNEVSVVSSFSSIGTVGSDFTALSQHTIWYIPLSVSLLFCSTLLFLSAILFRKKMIKFISRIHGEQKANL